MVEPFGGDHAGLLPQLALRGLKVVLACIVKLACGDFQKLRHERIAELMLYGDPALVIHCHYGNGSQMLYVFPGAFMAVGKNDVVLENVKKLSGENLC